MVYFDVKPLGDLIKEFYEFSKIIRISRLKELFSKYDLSPQFVKELFILV